jgi:predicted membrane GTPase involved in stress response
MIKVDEPARKMTFMVNDSPLLAKRASLSPPVGCAIGSCVVQTNVALQLTKLILPIGLLLQAVKYIVLR